MRRLAVALVVLPSFALMGACSSASSNGPPPSDDGGGGGGATGGAGGFGGMGGSGGEAPSACEQLGLDLQAALEATVASVGVPGGAVMAVHTADCGAWTGAAGEAGQGEALTPDHVMRIGSITKTYVAATIVDLAGEGVLSLDDPIDSFVSGVPAGDEITVRMLLNHTSGLFNITADTAFMSEAAQDPTKVYDPQTIVDAAVAHPAAFPPGTDWGYSNTNYILAGMVIEAATGQDAAAVIRARTLDPLGLVDTALDGAEPLPGEMPVGHGPGGIDATNMIHPSVPWTAGAMVASVEDVAAWGRALYGGELLSPDEMAEMLDTVDVGQAGAGYGLGVFYYPASLLGGLSEGLGHSGGIWGFVSDLIYVVDDGTVIAVVANSSQSATGDYLGAAFQTLYAE